MNKAHPSVFAHCRGLIISISICSLFLHFCFFTGISATQLQVLQQYESTEENSPSDSDNHEDDLVDAWEVFVKLLPPDSSTKWGTFLTPQSTDSDLLTPPPEGI
jgi:hypothetical protein